MIIRHTMRVELDDETLRLIAASWRERRPATRQEVKKLLDMHGEFGNANWDDVLEEGRTLQRENRPVVRVDYHLGVLQEEQAQTQKGKGQSVT